MTSDIVALEGAVLLTGEVCLVLVFGSGWRTGVNPERKGWACERARGVDETLPLGRLSAVNP